ncbi:helix-turn-helix transcriptional regulator [Neorhizobium sp. T25_27]|uniref:helix-turn-helix domain-containing protein n=1 Tax=Neorhizobium sp. T25_27 TaxID=2093831 RepID=UPI00155E4A24|nr:helix-turn-helix transcriptional regulator [Neorhizobium sp. T25_27]
MEQSENMKRLGHMIKKARSDTRLTTYQLGQMLQMATSDLSSVENGEKWPTEAEWEKISKLLSFPVDMLGDMKKPRKPQPIAQAPVAPVQPKEAAKVTAKVIDMAAYKKERWRQTSLFETD